MKKVIGLFISLAICIVALSSCAGLSIQRSVKDNLFTSSHGPKIAIKISPDFKYMGKFEVTRSIETTFGQIEGRKVPVKYTGYLFCEIGDNQVIKKIASINFSQILDYSTVQPKAPLKGIDDDINPGILKIEEEISRYSHKTFSDPLSHGMNRFIYDTGSIKDLSIAECYLFQTIERIVSKDSKILMTVDYAEDVEVEGSCEAWNSPLSALSEEQITRIDEFLRNSKENVQIFIDGKTELP